jgi:hypothetical protein
MPERFTAKERDLIRMEFMARQDWFRSLSEGIFLHRWGSGPHKGKPKLTKAVQSMLDRGLVKIVDPENASAYARFTAAGFDALRAMARDRRYLPPDQYGHLIEELQGTTPANENSRKKR